MFNRERRVLKVSAVTVCPNEPTCSDRLGDFVAQVPKSMNFLGTQIPLQPGATLANSMLVGLLFVFTHVP